MQSNFRSHPTTQLTLILIVSLTGSVQVLAQDPNGELAARIAGSVLLYQAPIWTGQKAPPAAESEQLWAQLEQLRQHTAEPNLEGLERFVTDHPDSTWRPSIEANLGRYDYEHGLYTRALNHWQSAWNATHLASDGAAKHIADFTFAYWTRLLASLGREDTLRELFRATQGRVFDRGPLQQIVNSTKEGYEMMLSQPGECFKCGTYALANVGKELKGTSFRTRPILDVPSPVAGFSMSRILELASASGLDLVAARWSADKQPIVPSIIHWKQDHYAAILNKRGDMYLVADPTFGRQRWLGATDIAEEATGEFIVPKDKLPADWQLLTAAETTKIYGRGFAGGITDPNDGCANGSGGSSPAGTQASNPGGALPLDASCSTCGGSSGDGGDCCPGQDSQGNSGTQPGEMPLLQARGSAGTATWSVSEPYVNLWLHDKPVGSYHPGLGYDISLNLSYKQRETRTIYTNIFSFGNMWDCSWLSYVTDDDPRYGSQGTLAVPGGGARTYSISDGTSVIDFLSNTILERNPATGTPLTNFIVTYATGAEDIYGFVPSTVQIDMNDVAFLSAKVDPFGHTTQFLYQETNSSVLLLYVVDGDGRTNTLSYTNSAFPTQVTGVTDPFGHKAFFQYDATGMLTNIIDAIGLTSSFAYDSLGWATSLTTAYGTTEFQYYTNGTYTGSEFGSYGDSNYDAFLPIRSVKIIDPLDGTNLYMLKQDSSIVYTNPSDYYNNTNNYLVFLPDNYTSTTVLPSGPTSTLDTNVDALLYYRDSFHWGPRQCASLPADVTTFSPSDFIRGRMRHWLHSDQNISQILDMEQAPSPDGVTLGQTTWFDYDGKGEAIAVGTQSLPSLIARVVPDGTTAYTWYQRDNWGRATNVIETYSTYSGQAASTRTNSYIYASNGIDLSQIIGPAGELRAGYGYDAYHEVTSFTNAVGDVTTYTYDSDGRRTSMHSPAGLTTTNIYFSSSQYTNWVETKIDLEISRTNSWTYTNDLVLTHTDPRGLTTTFTYDALQRPTTIADSRGTIYYYYSKLDPSQITDRMGFNTWFGHDALRRLTAETNALGYYTLYNYCSCGALESVQDKLGNLTSFYYDTAGRLTNTTYPDGYVVTNELDLLGRAIIRGDSAGIRLTNWFNNQGLLYASTNAAGVLKADTFDLEDRATNSVNGNGVSVAVSYDLIARTLTRAYADGGVEKFGYSSAGLVSYTNQIGFVTRYTYDAAQRKTAETNANSQTTVFSYDSATDLLTLTDPKSQTTTWNYDQYGRVTNKLDQTSTEILQYTYDLDDRLTNRWSAAKGDTAYSYDHVGNVTLISYPVTHSVTLTYDPMNHLTNMVDGLGTTVYGYTAAGQLLSEDGPFASDTVTNGYSNRLRTGLGLQQPTGEWTNGFTYDGAGRFSAVKSPAGTFDYYYASGVQNLVVGISLPNLSFITNLYDPEARMTATYLETSVYTIRDSALYGYNQANQRTAFTNAAGTYVQYAYDNIGQLKTAISSSSSENRGYAYDAAWNLNWRTNNGATSQFLVDTKNELTNAFNAASGYDANGNLISRNNGTNAYVYDDENRLIQWFWYNNGINCTNGGYQTDFFYDGLGRLRKRLEYSIPLSSGGGGSASPPSGGGGGGGCSWNLNTEVHYIYDGSRVIQELDGSNNPLVGYTRGPDLSGSLEGAGGIGGLLARSDTYSSGNFTSHTYYHADGDGNITYLENSSQSAAAIYRYDPYGNILSSSGTLANANVYRFSSKECCTNSGLYCYLFRFYDPTIQRWINRDPIYEFGGLNLYAYALNKVPYVIDLFGLDANVPSGLPNGGSSASPDSQYCSHTWAPYVPPAPPPPFRLLSPPPITNPLQGIPGWSGTTYTPPQSTFLNGSWGNNGSGPPASSPSYPGGVISGTITNSGPPPTNPPIVLPPITNAPPTNTGTNGLQGPID
ncbi:MAG TPA: RHS repeat-associated core domain-containing protein [Verrucomicrobiae bacterium]|nr:RHS repeat-associated core domain-containing protein [Verrucomicrobiae bacterium]